MSTFIEAARAHAASCDPARASIGRRMPTWSTWCAWATSEFSATLVGPSRAFVNRAGAALVTAIRLQSRVSLLGILGWLASAAPALRWPPSNPETPPLGVPGGSATGVA